MKYVIFALGLSAFAATNVSAQTVTETVTQVVTEAVKVAANGRSATLSSGTEITLTPSEDQTSKTLREGDSFIVSVMADVTQDGIVVIPKGTPGKAVVMWRTGKGAFGKSAKMDIKLESLTLGSGQTVALTGTHRQNGDGNTGATIGAIAAAGVIGGVLVTGKSAKIPHGMSMLARTAEAINYEIPDGAKLNVQAKIIDSSMAAAAEPATN